MSDAFDPLRWKPASLLPTDDRREVSLHFVVAVLCFLACLALLVASAAHRAAEGWGREIRSEATVQVRPGPNETGSSAAARAAEALAGVRGVEEAAALEREKAADLLRPWLGDAVLEDLPLPHLVTVRLSETAPASADDLRRALTAAGLDATVDDHGRWLADVERSAATAGYAGFAVFLLMAACAAAVVTFATRAGMSARRDVVEVLHLAGARDDFIAVLFQARFARLAAESGLLGAAAAAIVGGALAAAGGGDGLTPALPFAWSDLLWLLPCPFVAATVAAVSARLTTLRLLRGSL